METSSVTSSVTLETRYDRLTQDREPYLVRARECALLTLPQVFPAKGVSGSTEFYKPFQSIGARGVNNLANKLLLSLMPPNTPFFKLAADDQTIAEISDKADRAKIEEKFNEIERTVQTKIETSNHRAPFISAMKQLIIGGNTLLIFKENGGIRVIRLDNYVVVRDAEGNPIEVIYKETIKRDALPEDILGILADAEKTSADQNSELETVDVFTCYKLTEGRFKTWQEVRGISVPGSNGTYPKDKVPLIALRWSHEDGEDYSRSYVEEYIGDLQSAEGLSKAILDSATAAAKVVILVRPNGLTRAKDVVEAENLEVISGNVDDVALLQLNKQADMQVARTVLNEILTRVSYAFLMNTSIQRDAERVTAEEIREMVKELEDALGGTYALFAQEFQLPFVRILMGFLVKAKRIPDLSALKREGITVEPTITTGVEAIGRGYDLNKLLTFVREFIAPMGEQGFAELNIPDFLKRGGTSLGIDMDGLIRSEEQRQAAQLAAQQQRQQQLAEETMAKAAQSAAGPAAKAAIEQGRSA